VADSLRIILDERRTAFRPGEDICGSAEWSLDLPPKSVAAHLCWFTRGKGTVDMEVVAEKPFEHATATGQGTFSFRAPDQPYSFSGQLISLIWAVELVVDPGEHCERLELTIGPDATEIVLTDTAPDENAAALPAPRVI
jgi:hypothetical protein